MMYGTRVPLLTDDVLLIVDVWHKNAVADRG